jgi:hypothetical protein
LARNFSCLYENIVYGCSNRALELSNGTSNFFRFMYAPNCKNPYKIISSYSTLMHVCCDNAKGTLFELGGMGLSLISCGSESKQAQYIFKILSDFSTISIKDYYMHRQTGDIDNNLALEDCAIVYSEVGAVIDIDNFSIAEFEQIDNNYTSYFFKVEAGGQTNLATSVKNLRYYKNFIGTDNKKILM